MIIIHPKEVSPCACIKSSLYVCVYVFELVGTNPEQFLCLFDFKCFHFILLFFFASSLFYSLFPCFFSLLALTSFLNAVSPPCIGMYRDLLSQWYLVSLPFPLAGPIALCTHCTSVLASIIWHWNFHLFFCLPLLVLWVLQVYRLGLPVV